MLRALVVLVLLGALVVGGSGVPARAGTPPAIRFVAKPSKVTQATTATFVVRAPRGARLRCQLDARKAQACGRRITLEKLTTGQHRFVVRGTWHRRRLKSISYRWSVVVYAGAPGAGTTTTPGGEPLPSTSGPAPASDNRPTLATPPGVTGKPVPANTLTAVAGSWTGATSVARRWQRCSTTGTSCVDVPGRTGATYLVGSADIGHTLRVVETATNAAGSREGASAPTAVVPRPPANTSPPTISGTPKVGQMLQGDAGSWTGDDVTLTYQWLRCAYNVGAGCTNIDGATGLTYVPAADDVTQFLVLVVMATGPGGSTAAASAAAGPVTS